MAWSDRDKFDSQTALGSNPGSATSWLSDLGAALLPTLSFLIRKMASTIPAWRSFGGLSKVADGQCWHTYHRCALLVPLPFYVG